MACAAASLPPASPFTIQGAHVPGFGYRWLRYAAWHRWYAAPASAALSTRPRVAAMGVGSAHDANRCGGDGNEISQRLASAAPRISPDTDREYGHGGADHL